jgi:geranylgeranyl pyrophosphate synthase
VQELRQFATEIGLAFQILDDIKDLTEDSDDLGKPSGNDLRQGTVTLPTLFFARQIDKSSADWKLLSRVISDDDVGNADIHELIARIIQSGAIDRARGLALEYRDRGVARLDCIPDRDSRDLLYSWAYLALSDLD